MIFDEIVMENFGVYAGRQTAILTPSRGKPIILVGGLNGWGKTTLLDALQIVLYGKRARTSNRGRRSYDAYLRECIHREVNPDEGAKLELIFHRYIEGKKQGFVLSRSWRTVGKEVVESFDVSVDGLLDRALTDNWDEFIESYLPSEISHLFFFDGEQIENLAHTDKSAEILRTAVSALFGMDLIDRLEADLKVLERRKKAEVLDNKSKLEFERLQFELNNIDKEQEAIANKAGTLRVLCDKLTSKVLVCEKSFQREGGEIFVRRGALEERFNSLKGVEARLNRELRDLASTVMPLNLIRNLLLKLRDQAIGDEQLRNARILSDVLLQRDTEIIEKMSCFPECANALETITVLLAEDRARRTESFNANEILGWGSEFAGKLSIILDNELPVLDRRVELLLSESESVAVQLESVEKDLARVPSSEQIAELQALLDEARRSRADKQAELEATIARMAQLKIARNELELRLERVGRLKLEEGVAVNDKERILRHAKRSRETLAKLKRNLVAKRCALLESLIFSSFENLLRKEQLLSRLGIDPDSFEITLYDKFGNNLPFDRLSAGERQLLATAILWGLARASGRVLPMLIDTPLGRLDSSHRLNLVDHYFPAAAPQIMLLSTDEEIVGRYYEKLSPHVCHEYVLRQHGSNKTKLEKGYFQ